LLKIYEIKNIFDDAIKNNNLPKTTKAMQITTISQVSRKVLELQKIKRIFHKILI